MKDLRLGFFFKNLRAIRTFLQIIQKNHAFVPALLQRPMTERPHTCYGQKKSNMEIEGISDSYHPLLRIVCILSYIDEDIAIA